jgi:ABC-type transport system involved in multi-copper enzyme maturation permease subunit
MTAPTMPARPDENDAALPAVPWRRMAGVTWRQHRIALAGVAVLLGALALWLWIIGTPLHRAYAAAIACHPASSPACQSLISAFNGTNDHMTGATSPGGVFLQVVPVLIGAFAGAPVLAREIETGTFRYAWTQGFGRWRWALAKMVLLAAVLAAAAGACGVLVSWYYQPYFAAGNQALYLYEISPFATLFTLRGLAFPAWTVTAFVIGALAGMLIRRVVPAIVATLAVYAGLAIATAGLLREQYLTPLVTSNPNVPGNAWIISQWWTKGGRFAFAGNPPGNLVDEFCSAPPAGQGKNAPFGTFAQCLAPHGYVQWTSYQPASRFWPFQWIESGWLLALSALLIAVTIWLVRHRAA